MRYFIEFSYNGTDFHGSQVQPNGNTVQAEMEAAFATILRQPVALTFAGRTDAGVHAEKMIAHFDSDKIVPANFAARLNNLLPDSIAVYGIRPVIKDAHARFDALERTYYYRITTRKDPFLYINHTRVAEGLDFEAMNRAGRILMEYEDFGAFCKAHSDVKTTLCHVTRAEWIQTGETDWYFVISANRFLRNMVRAVVGTLIDVGRGRLTEDGLRAVIEGKRRSDAGDSMPGNALFLEDVKY